MEQLYRQVQQTGKVLQDLDAEWGTYVVAIEGVARAVEALGPTDSRREAVRFLMSISGEIGVQLTSIRSKLVKDVCEQLLRIVKETGTDFQELANALLPQIVQTARNSSFAVRQPGARLLGKVSEMVRYDLSLMKKIFLQFTQEKVRILLLDQLMIIFVFWSDDEVEMWDSDVLEMIRRGLEDQSDKVRKTARETLTRFLTRWSERVYELLDMPSNQSKMLLISEHPDSSLSAAILKKYPELVNKTEMLSHSRTVFAKRRSKYLNSPRRKLNDSIEIHVTTPPPKPRNHQGSAVRDEDSYAKGVVARTGISQRQDGSISRRLFEEATLANSGDGHQESVSEAFDRPQIYECPPNHTASESQKQVSANITESPIRQSSISRSVPMARSRSASKAEETALRHPDVRRIQETNIPSPSTRSPIGQGKHLEQIDTASTSSNSPNWLRKQPSLFPRPGSFTTKSPDNSMTSTPSNFGDADEDKAVSVSSITSDDYFSKPIPSTTTAIPTPPPPSTDNVTFRSRRRTFRSEQDSSPLQAHSTDLSAGAEMTRHLHIETASELDMHSNCLDQEAVSQQEQQKVDYTSDEPDSSVEESGHIEYDYEWHVEQLDDKVGQIGDSGDFRCSDIDQAKQGDCPTPCAWNTGAEFNHELDHLDESEDQLHGDSTVCANEVDTPNRTIADNSNTLADWHRHDEYSLSEHSSTLRHFEEEEANEEEHPVKSKPDNPRKDALEALLDVRAGMARLRAATRNEENKNGLPLKNRCTPTSLQPQTPITVGESQELQPPVQRDTSLWDMHRKTERSYFDRLTHADRYERESQTSNIVSGEFVQDQPLENIFDDQMPSQAGTFERVTAHSDVYGQEPFDFAKKLQPAQDCGPRADFVSECLPAPQTIEQPPESSRPREQAARFEAAEKLIAAIQPPETQTHRYYERPLSPEPERYFNTEPLHTRSPPTRMGPKLNPALANARSVVDVNKKDATSDGILPKPKSKQNLEDTSLKHTSDHHRPVPSVVDTSQTQVPASTRNGLRAASNPPVVMPDRAVPPPPARLSWVSSISITFLVILAALFCISGILQASRKMRNSHDYHLALKARIDTFEASIAESHEKVHRLEEDYAIWNEYVSKLAEEDEANALTQLEAIQQEVQKWQQDMKADLLEFRQALSLDSIETALAALRVNNTKQTKD